MMIVKSLLTKRRAPIVCTVLSLLILFQFSRAQTNDNISHGRKVNGGKPLNLSNQIHMSVINRKYLEHLSKQDNFLSTTITFSLYPVQYDIDESQQSIFGKGLTAFLREVANRETEAQLVILAGTVTNSKQMLIDDSKESKPMVKDHTLEIEAVISAQQKMEDIRATITSEEFTGIILNLCSIFSDDLIQSLKDKEEYFMDRSDDKFMDHQIFNHIQSVDVYLEKEVIGLGLSTTGKALLGSFITMMIILVGAISYSRFYRSGQIHKGLKDYKKSNNLQDYLNKYDLDHLSFAPYSNVESQPASQENRETGAQINQTDNINDTTSDGDTFITNHLSTVFSERFESGIIDYDNRTVSSMGSGISHLSTDGSLLMGECFAPPGKLGIAIDTLNGQPVVHRVREESPLSGVLRRLDVIAAIDDEDTTSMSAAAVTTLMAKKMDQKRKITYLRGKSAQRNLIKKLDD